VTTNAMSARAKSPSARERSELARGSQDGPERSEWVRPATHSTDRNWPLYEVFLRGKRGLNHVHVGSLHAADAEMALHHARDLYTRRNEGVSIWVVAARDITASSPDEKDPFFAPAGDKVYRHPTFYDIPDDVPHM
jgi:ring-1,2-phenylacetyl-CoA epoxidase subunit PaaB